MHSAVIPHRLAEMEMRYEERMTEAMNQGGLLSWWTVPTEEVLGQG